jgi:zinc transporter ZupT
VPVLASGLAAVVLAAVHLLARRFEEALGVVPRNRWLSVAGGVSIAYVFVHLLPEIAEVEEHVRDSALTLPWLERHGWIAALAGLAVFYGLEHHARRAREQHPADETPDVVGRIHVSSYAAYNAIAGYLLRDRAEEGPVGLALFAVAIGVHFLVNDAGLVEDHGPVYRRYGRWLVAGGVLLGWAVGAAAPLEQAAVAVLLAFLGGGIVMNVLKEELPDDRRSRYGAFLAALVAYAALLLVAA